MNIIYCLYNISSLESNMDFVLCPSCGLEIASYKPLYNAMIEIVNQEKLKKIDTHPDKIEIDLQNDADNSYIFEQLNVKKWCCRTHINTPIHVLDLISERNTNDLPQMTSMIIKSNTNKQKIEPLGEIVVKKD